MMVREGINAPERVYLKIVITIPKIMLESGSVSPGGDRIKSDFLPAFSFFDLFPGDQSINLRKKVA